MFVRVRYVIQKTDGIKFKSNNNPAANARIFIIPVINQLNFAYKWLVSMIDLLYNVIYLA